MIGDVDDEVARCDDPGIDHEGGNASSGGSGSGVFWVTE